MKTILFKIQQFPHLSETFILSQVVMAIEEGYNVKILVRDILDFKESTHSALLKKYKIDQKLIIDNYHIPENKFTRLLKAFIILSKKPFYWNKIIYYIRLKSKFSLSWIYEVDFYLQFRNTEIIHVQYGTNAHPVDVMKKAGLLNGRLIVSFHGHDAFFPINGFIQNKGYYDHLFSGNNLIIANTPYLANQLIEIGCKENKIEIIPVPVDTSYFYPKTLYIKDLNNKIRLISVGRLEKIKGHEFGIFAVQKLIEQGFDVSYSIIGEGSCEAELDGIIKENLLGNRIELLGAKSPEGIRKELWKADIFLMTSITFNNQIKETQGLVTLEAQACGLPVVAFNSGGVKYTLENGKTGYLCEEKNIEEYIKAIKAIITDKALKQKFSKNAEKFVKAKYSKSVISAKW
jgi:colanic acid/amylovoran biosynthesis glycosyltransferase